MVVPIRGGPLLLFLKKNGGPRCGGPFLPVPGEEMVVPFVVAPFLVVLSFLFLEKIWWSTSLWSPYFCS